MLELIHDQCTKKNADIYELYSQTLSMPMLADILLRELSDGLVLHELVVDDFSERLRGASPVDSAPLLLL